MHPGTLLGRLGYFRGYKNRIFNALRLIPTKTVYEKGTEDKGDRHDLESCNVKMLNNTDKRLEPEPDDLKYGDKLDSLISFSAAF